jgi:hypothetical protein
MKEIVKFLKCISSRINYIVDSETAFKIYFVMGNSSCDLDSFTSSIFYAFMKNIECGLLTTCNSKLSFNIKEKNNEIYIPVINCEKEELFWRLEISALCKKMELGKQDFVFFADVFDELEKTINYKGLNSKRYFVIENFYKKLFKFN